MNKRFSTLLAAALVAGSFSSAFAQLEGRNVEWKDAQASRAYYLAGVHFVSPTDYLQAFSLQGLVNGADITAANPVAAAHGLLKLKRLELLHIMLSKILKENSIWLLKRKMELML